MNRQSFIGEIAHRRCHNLHLCSFVGIWRFARFARTGLDWRDARADLSTRCGEMRVALNEYHLDDLARISGVTARNIRAYRERGLLDPPRRQGRSAIYDDYHLAQLQTIDELLGRGFTSAHVAEFFETMRAGGSVAELLGLQRAILRPRAEPGDETTPDGLRVKIDP